MSDEYRVAPYESEHRDQVLALQRHLWSPDVDVNAAYLDWKYHTNPAADEMHACVTLFEDRVVAMSGAYPSVWEYDEPGRASVLWCRADAVVDPDHRRRGLLAPMFEALRRRLARRGVDWMLATSASVPTARAAVDLGWRRAGGIARVRLRVGIAPELVRRSRLHRAARRLMRARRPLDGAGEDSPLRRFDVGLFGDGITVTESPDPAALASLVAGLPWDGRIRQVRDESFFSWRFANPLSDFRVLLAGDPAQPDGYLALQAHVDPVKRHGIAVIDWEAIDDVTAALLLGAVSIAGCEVSAATTSLPSARVGLMRRQGFVAADAPPDGPAFGPAVWVRHTGDDTPPGEWLMGTRRLTDLADWDWRDLYSDDY